MTILYNVIIIGMETVLLAALAPLLSGFIRKLKNNFRMRKGQGIFWPYYNLRKLFSKNEVISKNVSWIFYTAPVVVFATSALALYLILFARICPPANSGVAVIIAAFFILSLGRFFLALSGLDTASAFGGMGSSREMFVSSFAEPTIFVAVFALCMGTGTTFKVSGILAGCALLMAAIAETSRIPVDNQETHLELTMVHEAMVLEHSGRSLALIELASHVKQMLFFVLIAGCFFMPVEAGRWGWALFPIKIAAIGLVMAVIEVSVAKMRLFRVVDFLSFAFFVALVATITASLGL
ncbi:MAG: NADH-quinone oxidoreductase subunit H [Candidatus Omnitrophica bacterium]|nr:NADH-quinone oxidoreductase subunit H [Candidatus Omnitrophota bacterium]